MQTEMISEFIWVYVGSLLSFNGVDIFQDERYEFNWDSYVWYI